MYVTNGAVDSVTKMRGITPVAMVLAKRQIGRSGAESWAGATIRPKKAARKMVVTFMQPMKTVRPVPAW